MHTEFNKWVKSLQNHRTKSASLYHPDGVALDIRIYTPRNRYTIIPLSRVAGLTGDLSAVARACITTRERRKENAHLNLPFFHRCIGKGNKRQ